MNFSIARVKLKRQSINRHGKGKMVHQSLHFSYIFFMHLHAVFTEINAHHEMSAYQKQWFFKGGSTQNRWLFDGWFFKGGSTQNRWVFDGWFFKGGSTQNRWLLMDDFSKGGVHKTDGFWWVIFQRGGVHKTDGFWNVFYCFWKIKRPGRLFRQIR